MIKIGRYSFITQLNDTIVFHHSVIGIVAYGQLSCLIIQLGTTVLFYHTTEWYNCVLSFSDWDIVLFDHTAEYNSFVLSYN